MRNEKGITLIELLGVLVILGLLFTFLGAILVNSLKTSDRATTEQRLQQEANYITEKVRNEFLKSERQKEEELKEKGVENEEYIKKIILKIDGDKNQIWLYDDVISEGYTYSFCLDDGESESEECEKVEKIERSKAQQTFQLKLSSKDGKNVYQIDTNFSKLK